MYSKVLIILLCWMIEMRLGGDWGRKFLERKSETSIRNFAFNQFFIYPSNTLPMKNHLDYLVQNNVP